MKCVFHSTAVYAPTVGPDFCLEQHSAKRIRWLNVARSIKDLVCIPLIQIAAYVQIPDRYDHRRLHPDTRLRFACTLLETTKKGTKAIADLSGFGAAETMRKAFVKRIGITPSEYRLKFSLNEAA